MATISLGSGVKGLTAKETGKILDVTIDFSVTPYAAATVLSYALIAPVDVSRTFYQVVTASTDASTRTVGIGDGSAATTWVTALDMKTAGNLTKSAASQDADSAGIFYVANNTLIITLNHDLTSGVLRVVQFGNII
jgi:hypothetical protein